MNKIVVEGFVRCRQSYLGKAKNHLAISRIDYSKYAVGHSFQLSLERMLKEFKLKDRVRVTVEKISNKKTR